MSINPSPRLTLLRILALLFTLIFVATTYTFLHEAGHALFGIFFGGILSSFSIDFIGFSAHAGIEGSFLPWQRALVSIAGIGLPLVVWTIFLITRRQPSKDNPVLNWLLFIGSTGFYSTLLAWIFLPLFYMAGKGASDDSIGFLQNTGFHPLLVSALALAAWVGGLGLFVYKMGGMDGLREHLVSTTTWESLSAAARTTMRVMAILIILIVASTITINLIASANNNDRIPDGYSFAFEVSQAKRARNDEAVHSFNMSAPATMRFYFLLLDFDKGPVDLVLTGPDGYQFRFMQSGEKLNIGRATINPEPFYLEPGNYEIRFTAPEDLSTLKGYIKAGP